MAAVRMGIVNLCLQELCALSVCSAAEERIQKPPVRPEQPHACCTRCLASG